MKGNFALTILKRTIETLFKRYKGTTEGAEKSNGVVGRPGVEHTVEQQHCNPRADYSGNIPCFAQADGSYAWRAERRLFALVERRIDHSVRVVVAGHSRGHGREQPAD